MKTLKYTLIAAASFAIIAPASANLLSNGDFEAPQITSGNWETYSPGSNQLSNWTISGLGNVSQTRAGYLGQATQMVDLSGVEDHYGATISQSATTVNGQMYKLSLDVYTGRNFGYSGGVDVYVNNSLVASNLQTQSGWSYSFLGKGGSTEISLAHHFASGNVSQVDNVQLNAVPEPASIATIGLGIIGLINRRRRK